MIFKKFYLFIIGQLILFAITVFLFMWSINQPHLVVTSINLGIISVFQMIYLVHYISISNRDLVKFFEAFQFQDATLSFERKKGEKTWKTLYQNFDRILDEYRKVRNAHEKDRLFFLNILNHVNIGVLVISTRGQILFSNQTIRKWTGGREFKKIDWLEKLKPGLPGVLLSMKPNHRELIRIIDSNEVIMLAIRCSDYKMEGEHFRIISFQDINYEIEQREIEAWQKLIRIFTHEITNSVSPITLTSSGIIHMLEEDGHPKESKDIEDAVMDAVLLGLHAIRKRSKGLATFIESYRSMTQIAQPTFINIKIQGLFQIIESLMQDELRGKHISLQSIVRPSGLQVLADEKLIEQVLINLIKNATQALQGSERGSIRLEAWQNNQSVYISVSDNGKGIAPENMENIFVPFFTTKTEGSGIGLSLSRQIMRLHSGTITVRSIPEVETIFTLRF